MQFVVLAAIMCCVLLSVAAAWYSPDYTNEGDSDE